MSIYLLNNNFNAPKIVRTQTLIEEYYAIHLHVYCCTNGTAPFLT